MHTCTWSTFHYAVQCSNFVQFFEHELAFLSVSACVGVRELGWSKKTPGEKNGAPVSDICHHTRTYMYLTSTFLVFRLFLASLFRVDFLTIASVLGTGILGKLEQPKYIFKNVEVGMTRSQEISYWLLVTHDYLCSVNAS